MTVDLSPLEPLRASGAPHLPGYTGAAAIHGYLGSTYFIVTQDHDGHTEASLSLTGHRKPTDAQAAAFFRKWGVQPMVEYPIRGARHWVVAGGVEQ